MSALEVVGLHAGYGRIPVLTGIDLTVETGEFVGILGHNGMGKTTLMRALAGHLPVTAGRIALAGEEVTRAPAFARARLGLGYVPQGREIFGNLTVLENLRMGALREPDGAGTIAAVIEELPRLKPILTRAGGVLSGGEQQILALARCLCSNPKVILLDEPTEGIQPSIVDEIAETLQRLSRSRGLTMILVEQSLEFIRALSQRVLVIQKGTFIRQVSGAEVASLADELVGLEEHALS